MKKLPFVVMTRENYKRNMNNLADVRGECEKLKEKLKKAEKTIEDMKCGNLVCGDHCESCKNGFIHKTVTGFGTYTKAHCKLKAANTCVGYDPIDPA